MAEAEEEGGAAGPPQSERKAAASMSEEEVERAVAAFTLFDPDRSGLRLCNLGAALREYLRGEGGTVPEAEVFEMMCSANCSEDSNKMPFAEFLRLIFERRERLANPVSLDDLAMAFVACGGDPSDPESFVSRDRLVSLIKTDFSLAIDIEKVGVRGVNR
jgi:Ca2+-binding EF-hand superfamily protein